MEITFKLDAFEGPLDLLLHLIEVNKVDIYDIPIAMITDQYMAYLKTMESLDMDVTSDFILMAGELLKIKSQMLLPVEQKAVEEGGEDPRSDLVRRLIEYKMFKILSEELKDDAFEASRKFFKETTIPEDLEYTPPPVDLDEMMKDVTLERLRDVFVDVLKRQEDKIDPIRSKYGQIEQEPVNVSERMNDISRQIRKSRQPISFRKLMQGHATKENVIVTFLAVLELIRNGTVTVRQEALFDDIEIEPTAEAAGADKEVAVDADYD